MKRLSRKKRLSPKQLARTAVSTTAEATRIARAQAQRVEARIRPRPRHRVRNILLGVAGSLVAVAITAGLVGRRRSTEPSPLARAGTAAGDSLATGTEDRTTGVTEVVAAGAAAATSGAEAVGEDVTLGAGRRAG